MLEISFEIYINFLAQFQKERGIAAFSCSLPPESNKPVVCCVGGSVSNNIKDTDFSFTVCRCAEPLAKSDVRVDI